MVTSAFIQLLELVQWAGIFVSVLSPLESDILDAPVSFITGLGLPSIYPYLSYGVQNNTFPTVLISKGNQDIQPFILSRVV